ncbi:hypothetical protein F4808DRAFT_469008 [Astrocystis sublimbata]|nr:hypothetical protein F4808DRAFT_469008 [Astrocystis sublimbata]
MTANLPFEVIVNILENIYDPSLPPGMELHEPGEKLDILASTPSEEWQTLKNVSLVSRWWRGAALDILFRRVHIKLDARSMRSPKDSPFELLYDKVKELTRFLITHGFHQRVISFSLRIGSNTSFFNYSDDKIILRPNIFEDERSNNGLPRIEHYTEMQCFAHLWDYLFEAIDPLNIMIMGQPQPTNEILNYFEPPGPGSQKWYDWGGGEKPVQFLDLVRVTRDQSVPTYTTVDPHFHPRILTIRPWKLLAFHCLNQVQLQSNPDPDFDTMTFAFCTYQVLLPERQCWYYGDPTHDESSSNSSRLHSTYEHKCYSVDVTSEARPNYHTDIGYIPSDNYCGVVRYVSRNELNIRRMQRYFGNIANYLDSIVPEMRDGQIADDGIPGDEVLGVNLVNGFIGIFDDGTPDVDDPFIGVFDDEMFHGGGLELTGYIDQHYDLRCRWCSFNRETVGGGGAI